jgi:hypothetical protein
MELFRLQAEMYKVLVIVIIPGIPQYISKSGSWLEESIAKSIEFFPCVLLLDHRVQQEVSHISFRVIK